jgi:putative copper export protein
MTTFHMSAQLASTSDSIRLFLHVIGATIWVGGQLVFAALVPVLKKKDAALPKLVAHQFNKIAWPAYGLLLITGMWNMASLPKEVPSNYSAFLGIKMTVVIFSAVAAILHSRAKSAKGMAMWGALSGLAAMSATYLGVLLAG